MPDNPSPSAKSDSVAAPTEFNFDKPAPEVSRIKRRSLKTKTPGLKPANAPAAARELEREAPPLSAEQTARPATPVPDAKETAPVNAETPRSTAIAPPRRTPTVAPAAKASASGTAPTGPRPISLSSTGAGTTNGTASGPKASTTPAAAPGASGQKVHISLTNHQKATAAVLVASTPRSPHGTRPATLYYTTTQPKKEANDSMKTTTPASPTSAATTPSSSPTNAASASRPAAATTASASTARPATASAAATPRPAASNFDYRANVERQSREQKSVGSLLAYFVYGLIAVFLVGGGLAIYGSVVIFDKLHDQSTSISSLDDKYAGKVAALNKDLATTQDTLAAAQAQIARQQDLINKEQEQLNQLLAQINENTNALNKEHQGRLQEAATLRARIRDLEYKTSIQNLGRP